MAYDTLQNGTNVERRPRPATYTPQTQTYRTAAGNGSHGEAQTTDSPDEHPRRGWDAQDRQLEYPRPGCSSREVRPSSQAGGAVSLLGSLGLGHDDATRFAVPGGATRSLGVPFRDRTGVDIDNRWQGRSSHDREHNGMVAHWRGAVGSREGDAGQIATSYVHIPAETGNGTRGSHSDRIPIHKP